MADLEFVLAVRDQFPAMLLRAAYHGLAAAHAVLGHDEQAAEAERKTGLGAAPADTRLMFGDLDPPADGAISHLILTHAHWDHIGGAGALAGPGTRVIAQAGFPAWLDRQQGDWPSGAQTLSCTRRRAGKLQTR